MPVVSKDRNLSADPAHILVVDDERLTRRALSLILRSEFHVTEIENGIKAVEKIREGLKIDVASVDLNMPGMSGIETLRAIKSIDPSIEVLLVTAYSDIESAKQALKQGAFEYVDKPIAKEVYREAIRTGVRRRRKSLEAGQALEQLHLVKAQLVHAEKLSAVGEMLAGVVHEINTPLTGIIGYADLLQMQAFPPEKRERYIENIQNSAKLCQNIVQNLLSFARKHESTVEPIRINEVLESTLELLRHEIKVTNTKVSAHLAPDLPRALGDFHRLQQVFLNLINNAIQAMGDKTPGGSLSIRSESNGKTIRVQCRDNGPGIPPENLQKIFEPFFTTKPEGKGTGLGLSICYDIIQAHRGDIYVSSEPGVGTTFVVELPMDDQGSNG